MPDTEKLLNAIDAAEERSFGSDQDSELETERARAIEFYLGRNIDPAPEGRSQVIDRSVFETIQWVLPSLCRIFANGDDVVELAPFGPEDEEQARQESDYLNYVVTQKNRWFDLCLTWFQDALLTKNAYCLAFMDESIKVEKERYEGQAAESVALLVEGAEVVGYEEYVDEESDPEPVLDAMGSPVLDDLGQPVFQPRMLYNVEIRRTKPQKKLCFRVLPPERCKVSEATPDHTLEHCDYFEYWEWKTISQLRAEGFDIPDDIASDEEVDSEEDDARDQFEDEFARYGRDPVDPAMRRVKARMVWIRHDYDEDGIAELQRVLVVGRKVLFREEESRIPVACIVPAINTHRHIGTSLADMVADIQRIKTAILRQGLDNLYLANNQRHAISDKVNLDDMLVSRPGGLVRIEQGGIPANEIMPMVTPFIFPQAMQGLEYMDQVRENRTGTNRYFTGIDQNALNKTASGIQQLSTMAAQRVEQIARIFAAGIEYLFSVGHELILKHGHQGEVVRLRGQWVQVDPTQWRTGRDMRIVVGFGAGNKDALVSRLMLILNAQKEAMMGGLRVATEENVYEALVELTKASDFTAPQRFWTDPRQLPPPEDKPSEAEIYASVEQKKLESSEREKLAELQQRESDSQRRAALDEYRANLDAEVKVVLEQLRQGATADIERLRSSLKNAPIELENEKLEQANRLIEALAVSQSAQTEQVGQMLTALGERLQTVIENMTAPKEIVRDKSGKVTGVRVNGREVKVRRDSNGRIVGT